MSAKTYHHGDLKNALIKAGVEILAKEGVSALSLRKVAQRAGVSHSAPYAHFTDKQALIAAISTEGFTQLYLQLVEAVSRHEGDSKKQLIEAVQVYVRFAMENSDTFKIMFSGILEQEKNYPAFVEVSRKTFELVLQIVKACQEIGLLKSTDPGMMAVAVWGQVHGIVLLALEGQFSHTVLDHHPVQEIVTFATEQLFLPRSEAG